MSYICERYKSKVSFLKQLRVEKEVCIYLLITISSECIVQVRHGNNLKMGFPYFKKVYKITLCSPG